MCAGRGWLSSLPMESYLCYESADELIWLEQLCSHGALGQISNGVVGHLQAGSISCCRCAHQAGG